MINAELNSQEPGGLAEHESKEKQPLVSVIIPVRNRVEQLEAAIISVLAQKEGVGELIVIDGASTDGTVEIIRKYSDRIAYWVSEPDQGIYDAMNKGVKRARGKYVLFLGSDDTLIARLDELESVLCDRKTVYYGNIRTKSGKGWDGPFSSWRLAVRTINHQSMFYPISAFDKGGFSARYKIYGDWEFNIRCFGDKDLRFQYIPFEIAFFSRGGISSQVADDAFAEDRFKLIRQHLPWYTYIYARVRTCTARLLGKR